MSVFLIMESASDIPWTYPKLVNSSRRSASGLLNLRFRDVSRRKSGAFLYWGKGKVYLGNFSEGRPT